MLHLRAWIVAVTIKTVLIADSGSNWLMAATISLVCVEWSFAISVGGRRERVETTGIGVEVVVRDMVSRVTSEIYTPKKLHSSLVTMSETKIPLMARTKTSKDGQCLVCLMCKKGELFREGRSRKRCTSMLEIMPERLRSMWTSVLKQR